MPRKKESNQRCPNVIQCFSIPQTKTPILVVVGRRQMSGGLFDANQPRSKGFTWEGMKKKKEVSERALLVKIVVY